MLASDSGKWYWNISGVGILIAAVLLYPVQALTVRPSRGSGLIRAVPASVGDEFRLTWTHTVSRRPVSETFSIGTDGCLCLRSMVFDHEGPNLPAGPEGGTVWRTEGNRVIVSGYRLCQDELRVGVAPFGHWLEAGRWKWDMKAAIGPDRFVRVAFERTLVILMVIAEVRQWSANM